MFNKNNYEMSNTDLEDVKTDKSRNGLDVENEEIINMDPIIEKLKDTEETRVEIVKPADENVKADVGVPKNVFGFFKEERPPRFWVQFSYGRGSGAADDRNAFVKLVLSIVLVMMIITAIFTAIVYEVDELRETFLRNAMILIIFSAIIVIGVNYALTCSACARSPPCNFIMLILSLIGMSIMCAVITARYRTELVVLALIATCVTVFVCVLLACSNIDFTKFLIYVIVAAAALAAVSVTVGIYMLVTHTRMPIVSLIMLVGATLLQVVILIIQLQMILGGKSVEIGENEYILAAILIYLSVIELFLDLLRIIGTLDDLDL